MSEANERLKELRNLLKKNQSEWAEILGISRTGVSEIESGRRNVTGKHIKILCSNPIDGKFINEEYLRSGSGEPFVSLDKKDEIMSWANEVMKGQSKEYISRFSAALSKLNINDWELLAVMAETLAKQKEAREQPLNLNTIRQVDK